MEERAVICSMCPGRPILITEPEDFFVHVRDKHQFKKDFFICCIVDGCSTHYHLYDSFRIHWGRSHRIKLDGSHQNSAAAEEESTSNHVQHLGPTGIRLKTLFLIDSLFIFSCLCFNQLYFWLFYIDADYVHVDLSSEEELDSSDEELERGDALFSDGPQPVQPIPLDAAPFPEESGCQDHAGADHDQGASAHKNLTDREWEAGVLLTLHHKYFLPFDGLTYVSSAFREHLERQQQVKEKLNA